MWLFLSYLRKSDDQNQLIWLYSFAMIPALLSPDWALQGMERMEYLGLGRAVGAISMGVFVFLFIRDAKQVFYIPVILLLCNFLSFLIVGFYFKKITGGIFADNFTETSRSLDFSSIFLIGFSLIMFQIITSINVLFLGTWRTDFEIGLYNAAFKLTNAVMTLSGVYFDAVFPIVSRAHKKSAKSLEDIQNFNVFCVFLFALPVSLVFTIFARQIIELFFGIQYIGAVPALQILAWSLFMMFVNGVFARGLWACDMEAKYSRIIFLQALILIALGYGLIPRYGIVGAALGSFVTELIAFLFYSNCFKKLVHIKVIKQAFLAAAFSVVLIFPDLCAEGNGKYLVVFFILGIYSGVSVFCNRETIANCTRLIYSEDGREPLSPDSRP